jgi:Uma2 family endonuclease
VVEVVSRGSDKRDYDEKPEDYFQCGAAEATLCPGDVYESPLLPGFQFDLQQLFESPSL